MEIVFYIPSKNESKFTKLTKSATTPKKGFIFAIDYCKEFSLVTPLAFSVNAQQLYYYDDTEINAYLNNQKTIKELLDENQCDLLIRNTEILVLPTQEIDQGSLFLLRGKYAYYITDFSIRIPIKQLDYKEVLSVNY